MTARLVHYGPAMGFIGSAFFAIASLIAGVFYVGTQSEPFSPLNHWVSELGEMGVSSLALVFNIGLFVGGLALALFFFALGRLRSSRLASVYVIVGIVAGVSGALVGVFPMNNRSIHIVFALGFFVLGWVAVGLASLDIWRRPEARFSRWLPALGALTVAVFLLFLSVYIPYLYTGTGSDRPDVSIATVLEWLVLIGIMGWVLVASATWWRHGRGSRNTA
ncbi:MAG TPA: DUF998 domain-containing protein [Candidatus Limnocylindrales bacterium]|jgi:hypothetical membrane protein